MSGDVIKIKSLKVFDILHFRMGNDSDNLGSLFEEGDAVIEVLLPFSFFLIFVEGFELSLSSVSLVESSDGAFA